jgi:hypothetical protein
MVVIQRASLQNSASARQDNMLRVLRLLGLRRLTIGGHAIERKPNGLPGRGCRAPASTRVRRKFTGRLAWAKLLSQVVI